MGPPRSNTNEANLAISVNTLEPPKVVNLSEILGCIKENTEATPALQGKSVETTRQDPAGVALATK
jgi:hypothetical protein